MVKEETVTAEDIKAKWHKVEEAVQRTTHQKVVGVSYITVGAIVLGAGALGTAFWLGRRSATAGQKAQPPQPGQSFVGVERPQMAARPSRGNNRLGMILQPMVDSVVRSAVSAMSDRIRYKPECEARL